VKKQAIVCVDDEVIILLSLIQELKHAFGSNYLYEKATDADSALAVFSKPWNPASLVAVIAKNATDT